MEMSRKNCETFFFRLAHLRDEMLYYNYFRCVVNVVFRYIFVIISLLTLWAWAKNRLARDAESPTFWRQTIVSFMETFTSTAFNFNAFSFASVFHKCCSVFDIVVRLIEIAWTHFAYVISIWQKSFRQSEISLKFGKKSQNKQQKPHKRKICFHQSQTHSRDKFFRFVVQNPFLCLLYGNILW